MPNSRPVVLVTESEYRKAEACFASSLRLECRRAPDREADLVSAIREARASHVVVGAQAYAGALYEALPAGENVVAFTRGFEASRIICLVARHSLIKTKGERPFAVGDVWNGERLAIPYPGTYRTLVHPRDSKATRYVWPFQARTSLLVWKVFGRRTDGFPE